MAMIAAKGLTMSIFMILSCTFSGINTGKFQIIMMKNNNKVFSMQAEARDGKYIIYTDEKEVAATISRQGQEYVFEAEGIHKLVNAYAIAPPKLEGNGKATKQINGVEVLFLSTEGVRSLLPMDSETWAIISSV